MKKNPQTKIIKLLLIFNFLLFTNFISAQDSKDLLSKAIAGSTSDTRGMIKEDEGAFRLDYDDVYEKDTQAKFLQEKGYHGGGPSWFGVLYGALTICGNDLVSTLDSDVSVTGVSFWSEKKEDLEKISRVISVIKSNENILLESIEKAKEQEMMH